MKRVATGIIGLDTILHGGLLAGAIYFILGRPGAGKTILGNQFCFNHVAAGGRAVYISLLTETNTQMLAHLESMTFFDPKPLAQTLFYFSGFVPLQEEGLKGLSQLLRQVLRDQKPTLLVIDGLGAAEVKVETDVAYQRFLDELSAAIQAVGCTALLLMQPINDARNSLLYTMADGLLKLSTKFVGPRMLRHVHLQKFRGSGFIEGQHAFRITNEGIVVYPRTEALPPSPSNLLPEQPRLKFGINALDQMIDGGLLTGTTTLLLGAPGSGKTLLGLHFLATGARDGQVGLHFSFDEKPPQISRNAHQIGLDLYNLIGNGTLHLEWTPPLESALDALAAQILDAVRRHKVQRLFIDELGGLLQAADDPERLQRFLTALTLEFQAHNVTVLYSIEMENLFGPSVELATHGTSRLADNILLLRYVELRSHLHRLISILKMRGSNYDTSIREFQISRAGLTVASTFESAEAVLTGIARLLGPHRPSSSVDAPVQDT